MENQALLQRIKQTILEKEPGAEIILYGSRSRGEANEESDWDLLILLDGAVDDTRKDTIRHALYEIEWELEVVICSIIYSWSEWNEPQYKFSPFHQNIEHEGVSL